MKKSTLYPDPELDLDRLNSEYVLNFPDVDLECIYTSWVFAAH